MNEKTLCTVFAVLLIVSVSCGLYVNTVKSPAVEFPAIMVTPENIWDDTLQAGDNVTFSIYTDYNGSDVWAYQFTLFYNPNVLHAGVNKTETWTGTGTYPTYFLLTHIPILPDSLSVYVDEVLQVEGVDYQYIPSGHPAGDGLLMFASGSTPASGAEIKAYYLYGVLNGDLITQVKDSSAEFTMGNFNNTSGMSSLTVAYFFYMAPDDPYYTSGPGFLANITFTVVGYGVSNITLGSETKLKGYNTTSHSTYDIINAQMQPDHIQHGYFNNRIPGDICGDDSGTTPDGDVDWFDFGDFAAAYGSSIGQTHYNPLADLMGDTDGSPPDGDVDWFDFGEFAANYGTSI
jgi:hypothetical protein